LRYPGVIVSTTISNSENVVAMVHEGSADLGLVEAAIDDPTLAIAPVAEDELILVAPLLGSENAASGGSARSFRPPTIAR
jgi:DNA-binding transcriptional LysR family regulator